MNYVNFGCRWDDKGNREHIILDIFQKYSIVFAGLERNDTTGKDSILQISKGDLIAITDGTTVVAVAMAEGKGNILQDLEIPFEDDDLERFSFGDYVVGVKVSWFDLGPEDQFPYGGQGKRFQNIRDFAVQNKIQSLIQQYLEEYKMQNNINLLKSKKQIILQGAPGVGKTYSTAELAVLMIDENFKGDRKAIMERYQQLVEEKRVFFTTFHLSLDYEDFVEGYKPNKDENGALTYEVKSGIFKRASEEANALYEKSLAISSKNSRKNTLDEAKKLFYGNLRDLPERKDDTGMMSLNTKGGIEFYIRLTPNNTLYVRSSSQNKVQWHHANLELYYSSKQEYGVAPYAYPILDHLKEQYELISYGDLLKQEKENQHTSEKPIVLIIDEINRGNISKIFGELITLLEGDKRRGAENELPAILPYSNLPFTVPPNLYIIGTMNTADRSIGMIDYALRRRFAFVSMVADESKVCPIALELFKKIEKIINENISSEFEKDDLMIGHSYFMASNPEELQTKVDYEIKPLLREYLRDGILLDQNDLKKQINALSL